MSQLVPPAVNYPTPLIAIPSNSQDQPREGRQQVAIDCLWGTMGGTTKTIAINLQNNAVLNFTQISSLKIDNSNSGADVDFIFTDTGEIITIPANTPLCVVPVFSNALQFYVSCPNATPEDETRFIVLNYALDPADVNTSLAGSFSGSGTAVWIAPGPVITNIIPSTIAGVAVNGTLQNLIIAVSYLTTFTVNSFGQFQLRDGQGNVFIPAWKLGVSSNITQIQVSQVVLQIDNANIRFRSGLIIEFDVLVGWNGSYNMNALATYKQP